MSKINVVDMAGKVVSELELNDAVFGIKPNKTAMHSAVVNYLANQRQGTQSTLTRTEVRGGGRKPWRQKGTGHARQGSIRAPQWRHGGIALGPKPRSYKYAINNDLRQLAIKSALSSKALENEMIVVDSITANEFKTKTMVSMLKAVGADAKTLIVLETPDVSDNVKKLAELKKDYKAKVGSLSKDERLALEKEIKLAERQVKQDKANRKPSDNPNYKVIKSAANIAGVKTIQSNMLNVYDILNCDKFVVVQNAVKQIEEVYA